MENTVYSDELQHHGTKGMRWGVRRYQNKDGSLTPAGQKRYNKEVEKLKKETEKVKAAEKVAAERKKTQSKFDKLEEKKQQLEARKKALKGEKDDTPDDIATAAKKKGKTPEEEIAERREKLLKSSDAKELYKNKDLLTSAELNERLQRIDLESRLQSKIPQEEHKTAAEWMDSATKTINSASALYKSVDSAYSSFANSGIAKALGLELPTGEKKEKAFNAEEFLAKMRENKLTAKEIQDGTNALKNINTSEQQKKQIDKGRNEHNEAEQARLKKETEAENKKALEKAMKEYSDYQEKIRKEYDADSSQDGRYHKFAEDIIDRKVASGKASTSRLLLEDKSSPKPSDTSSKPKDGDDGGGSSQKSSTKALPDKQDYADRAFQKDMQKAKSMVNSGNYTQAEIAKKLGVSESSVSKYAGGEKKPTVITDKGGWREIPIDDSSDLVKRAQKAAENLSKAAQKSSKEAERVETIGDDVIRKLIEENERKLNGR